MFKFAPKSTRALKYLNMRPLSRDLEKSSSIGRDIYWLWSMRTSTTPYSRILMGIISLSLVSLSSSKNLTMFSWLCSTALP